MATFCYGDKKSVLIIQKACMCVFRDKPQFFHATQCYDIWHEAILGQVIPNNTNDDSRLNFISRNKIHDFPPSKLCMEVSVFINFEDFI